MALSRSVYKYLRYGKEGTSSSQSRGATYPQRSGYINQTNSFTNDVFDPPSTVITAGGRRPSVSKSESSDIPLQPGIHMKTSFAVQEEYPVNDIGQAI